MIKRHLFKSAVKLAIIGFITMNTLTACNMNIKLPNNESSKGIISQIETVIQDVTEKVGDIIDGTDFKDKTEIETMVNDIKETVNNATLPNNQDQPQTQPNTDISTPAQTQSATEHKNQFELQEAKLVRVVDGDTIVVEIDGEQLKVRLIGIDTPESVASKEYLDRTGKVNSAEGVKASDYTKALLENCTKVYLLKDVSDTDRYGRLLRYVFIIKPNDLKNISEIADKMLNAMLLADHIAKPAKYKPDVAYADMFQEIYDNYKDFDRD